MKDDSYRVTSKSYSNCFGFTEQEVKDALKCQNIDTMKDVKEMYDGFIIGGRHDIYNPWSIISYMRHGELISYWINTSSNKLIGDIIRRHPVECKYEIEQLMSMFRYEITSMFHNGYARYPRFTEALLNHKTELIALRQIEERGYEADLLAAGIAKEQIYKLGFAFCGKDVLIAERKFCGNLSGASDNWIPNI